MRKRRTLLSLICSVSLGLSLTAMVGVASAESASISIPDRTIHSGMKYLGAPYQYGANPSQTSTFDCSSFTYRAFIDNGITLPRTSNQQYALGTTVALSQAQSGDLVFYKLSTTDTNPVSHVGIYLGGMKMLHASTSKGVTVTDISTSYWTSRYVGTKHVIPTVYTVAAGDTLWKISMAKQRTVDELRAWNRLTSDMIVPGQQLMLDNPNLLYAASSVKTVTTYYVKSGDTLWLIASRNRLTVDQLKAWNNLTQDLIYVGQRLVLEAP